MGGTAANWIAANYPRRVIKMVLLGPVHPNPGGPVVELMKKRSEIALNGMRLK
jgi:hypothetical protein